MVDSQTFDMSTARVVVFDTFFTDLTTEQLDVDRLLRDLHAVRANCLRLAAYSHVGYSIYPSQVVPLKPGLAHDLFGEIVTRCRNEGVAVVAYINAGFDAVLPDSDSFAARRSDGNVVYWNERPPWGVRYLCFNHPRTRDLFSGIIDEVCTYDVQGLYFDETVEGFCHCSLCRERYCRETGRDMPEVDRWTDPGLWDDLEQAHSYMDFRRRVLLDWRRFLVDRTRLRKASALTMINCGGYLQKAANTHGASTVDTAGFIDGFLTEAMIRSSGLGINHVGQNARFAENAPFTPWVHVELKSCSWTFDVAPREELMVKTGMLAAHGGRPAAYTYHQNGQSGTLATLAPAYERVAENEDVLAHSRSEAQIAVLYSRASAFAYARNDPERLVLFEGAYNLIEDAQVCFDVLDPTLTVEAAGKYRLLILPDAAILSDSEQEVLREFVRTGGSALVMGECASADPFGRLLEHSGLADVLGGDIVSRRDDRAPLNAGGSRVGRRCYFNLTGSHPVLAELEPGSWQPKSPQSIVLDLTAGNSLAGTVTAPCRPPVMAPGEILDVPSVVVNQFGQGKVVYLPWLAGGVYFMDEPVGLLKLFNGALDWLLDGRRIAELDAPCPVEISLRETDGTYTFHMVDYTGRAKVLHEPGLSAISGRLRLPDDRTVRAVRSLDRAEVDWKQHEDGLLEFHVPIDRWQALIIT